MIRLLTTIFLFSFSVGLKVLNAASVKFSETESEVRGITEKYSLRIRKDPFQMDVIYGDRVIMTGRQLFIVRSGKEANSLSAGECKFYGNRLEVTVETGLVPVSLVFGFEASNLKIDAQTKDELPNDKLGFRFPTGNSGHWFGGNVTSAHNWPLETASFSLDPFDAESNQTSPIWLTSSGAAIFVDTYHTMGFSMNQAGSDVFEFHVKHCRGFRWNIIAEKNIREAYHRMIKLVGIPRVIPPKEYFKYPVFNTWIEFQTDVNQPDIMEYVHQIRANGFPAAVFDIDDKWTSYYGDFEFDPAKFPDPGAMISELRNDGLKVALWVTPFIEKDARNYHYALDHHYLIMDGKGRKPYSAKWWNGYAALVDLSNPDACAWFLGELKDLQNRYGVDGFKLDAGDADFLQEPFQSYGHITPNQYADLFASLGDHFEINELRVSWTTQKNGLVQRLRDKAPSWSSVDGIGSLLPHSLCQSMLGYVFSCPDMIGGGLDSGFNDEDFKGMDTEMFVRWTQASALMPMMQFSYAPWKLDRASVDICRRYTKLHTELGEYIYSLAQQAGKDGTPIVRPLFFEFPEDSQVYNIDDQFMLGDRILVAPVLSKGAVHREVYLPAGTWSDMFSGKLYQGGQSVTVPAPLEKLPVFIRL